MNYLNSLYIYITMNKIYVFCIFYFFVYILVLGGIDVKKRFKIIAICFLLLMLTACGIGNTPTSSVERLLAKYNNADEDIVVELDDYINSANLTDEQNEKYKNVYLKQFKDMKYEIKEEKVDGDNATVTAQITVYDYYKVENDANNYLTENKNEFMKDNEYDEGLFTDYKLKKLEGVTDTVDYTIDFTLTKVDNDWVVNDLTNEQLEKIHGVYAY